MTLEGLSISADHVPTKPPGILERFIGVTPALSGFCSPVKTRPEVTSTFVIRFRELRLLSGLSVFRKWYLVSTSRDTPDILHLVPLVCLATTLAVVAQPCNLWFYCSHLELRTSPTSAARWDMGGSVLGYGAAVTTVFRTPGLFNVSMKCASQRIALG